MAGASLTGVMGVPSERPNVFVRRCSTLGTFSRSERQRRVGFDGFPHVTRQNAMTDRTFPTRIETDRLVFERLSHETVDLFELYAFVSTEDWQGEATEPMPWFRFRTLDDVASFVDYAEDQWAERASARYLLRTTAGAGDHHDETEASGGELVGTTAFVPEWEKRYAGSDVVLSKQYWGRGIGPERGDVFVELAFDRYDLDAYCTSCAAGNEPSRRMLEKLVDRYGGRYEGRLRNFGAPRPDGEVTDQHRYSITRSEYREATTGTDGRIRDLVW